ncbi:MAG: ATP-binding cassette domain-containing protein [bacterium]
MAGEGDLYRLDGLAKVYGERLVLDIPGLRVLPGTICSLVGENGSGKSTLLRLLALLEEPTRGRLLYRGSVLNGSGSLRARVRREVTLVEQNPYLFHGTVYDNVVFGLRTRGVPKRLWASSVQRFVETLELEGLLGRPAHGLSAGETQRAALARALVTRPKVLLLDEPTASVDAAKIPRIERLLEDLRERHGTTIVFSTHNRNQAERLADQVLLLAEGRIQGGCP